MRSTLVLTAVFVAAMTCGCACQQTHTLADSTPAATSATTLITEVVPVQTWGASTMKYWLEQDATKAKVEVDDRTNSVILHGTPDDVEQARQMVQQMDRPC